MRGLSPCGYRFAGSAIIGVTMPSPIGHALAGLALAWGSDLVPGACAWRDRTREGSIYARAGGALTVGCVLLAAAPDLDLVVGGHRTATHSITAAVLVALVAGALAVVSSRPVLRIALMCGGAWATHLLLDWVAVDAVAPRGIQLLWPFSRDWFISGWDVFAGTERIRILSDKAMRQNAMALARELAILLPLVYGLWLVRIKALARLTTELSGRDLPMK